MRNWLRGLLSAAYVTAGLPAINAEAAGPPEPCKLRPVMLENFDDDSIASSRIGPARWTAHTPWNGDFGDAAFADPGPGGPFKIKDGVLTITAAKNPDGRWTSGLIAAADSSGAGTGTRYGYFEVRMKMPPGPGTWPAFWLMPLKPARESDARVEIDVIEYYGHATDSYQSVVHVWFDESEKKRGHGVKIDVPDGSLVSDYHTFGVDVSPQALVFFFDGKKVWSHPTPPELNYPMYPIVNLALGSGWPIDKTPNPSSLMVDYVHVYGRDAGPPEGCPPGPPTVR
jgi:beta-glucanase (GH16 family)